MAGPRWVDAAHTVAASVPMSGPMPTRSSWRLAATVEAPLRYAQGLRRDQAPSTPSNPAANSARLAGSGTGDGLTQA